MKKNNNSKTDDPFQQDSQGKDTHPHLWEEWQSIDDDEPVPADYTAAMKKAIDWKIRPVIPISYWRIPAAAACIGLLIGLGSLLLYKKKTPDNGREEFISFARQELLENNTQQIMSYLLPDSSLVNIYPAGKIQFYKDFSKVDRREIILYGQAVFQVRPGKKPFSVRSGPLTTTALGTVFEIKEAKERISIKLLKGKVVIQSGEALPGWEKDVYLLPGEQVVYDQQKGVSNKTSLASGNRKSFLTDTATAQFDNEPLANVFSQLEKKYQRPIVFNKEEMAHQYFTGAVFPQEDSLEMILKVIANMKGLKLSDSGGVFYIHK